MLGFAAGVMIAASYWSLLTPAIEMAGGSNLPAGVPATSGFLFEKHTDVATMGAMMDFAVMMTLDVALG